MRKPLLTLLLLTTGCAANADAPDDAAGSSEALSIAPLPVPGVVQADLAAPGPSTTCARLTGTTGIACWGNNGEGELGDGVVGGSSTYAVRGPAIDASDLSTGGGFSCAIRRADGTVGCWGWNREFRLGSGTEGVSYPTPRTVPGIVWAQGIAAGSGHACAIDELQSVRCWGRRAGNLLGDGSFQNQPPSATPIAVKLPGGAHARAIRAGTKATCVITAETRDVVCWGTVLRPLGSAPWHVWEMGGPTRVPLPGPARSIAVGDTFACAVVDVPPTYDGLAVCWGTMWGRQGVDPASPLAPSSIAAGVSQVVAGNAHACVRFNGGQVGCLGADDQGQLGNGTTTAWLPFVWTKGLPSATSIAASGNGTCAVASGNVYCWGGAPAGVGPYAYDRSVPHRAVWPPFVLYDAASL